MKIMTTYKTKIRDSHRALANTVEIYRQAVDFLIGVALEEWNALKEIERSLEKQRAIECVIHHTKSNPCPKYDFDSRFGKFPSYLRRAAITEAVGKVSSYKSNYANWEGNPQGKEPGIPVAGYIYPAMYRDNCFVRTGTYTARLKVWIRNTWDWLDVQLRKSDVDYIQRHCATRKECAPTLRRRGKNWYLDFTFEENVKLEDKPIDRQIIIGVDLGINNACTCSAMLSDGTVIGRKILSLPREKDSLVFEHLDTQGKKRGSKKQRLHHWRAQAVQRIVADKAHRDGVRVRRVCAWNTSKLAFDGSGEVERDEHNYSMCTFKTGKRYHCDLSASYNIGARYFIREILKSLPAKARLGMEAKVPQCTKRTTCTLSTLLSLNAELVA